MRKLYELELNQEEVEWLIFAVEFLQEERDMNGLFTALSQELKAQRDRDEVGMTEILLAYQETIRTGNAIDTAIADEVKEYGEALDAVALEDYLSLPAVELLPL